MKVLNTYIDLNFLQCSAIYLPIKYCFILFSDGSTNYYSVALIKKNTLNDVYNLGNLKGKKACFAGVGTQAGWNIPINTVR